MSARRQPSTTSLSRYARAHSPDPAARSLDFCNSFWGLGDGGVDVLFARTRGAARTVDELRAYWKERALIEDEYAKRMAKLAKTAVGRDEIGELRNSLDTLRAETDKQASYHAQLAQQIRNDIEAPTATFYARLSQHRKTYQAAVEKSFKMKQAQEGHVNKAREKYEADCQKINAYTAQSTLVQGKDLDKINVKLERAQQTVLANQKDFENFSRVLQETVRQWEIDWKSFCDLCQDLEEERMDFVKDIMWAYANAVSTVCVNDDESCEKLRVSLEQFEPEKDMENFVRDYGTGSAIPDPPRFINYTDPEAVMKASSQAASHPAQFTRTSQRANSRPSASAAPSDTEEETPINTAGVGACGGRRNDDQGPSRSQNPSRASVHAGYVNGTGVNGQAASSSSASRRPEPPSQSAYAPQPSSYAPQPSSYRPPPPADPHAEPIDPTSKTMIKIGDAAYEVDLSRDPQAQTRPGAFSAGSSQTNGSSALKSGVGDDSDPLARQMAELRNQASSSSSVSGRKGQQQQPPPPRRGTVDSVVSNAGSTTYGALSPPTSSANGNSDANNNNKANQWRNSAEMVVGSYPPQASTSRSASPTPPTAAFMSPPKRTSGYDLPVEDVMKDYEQSLPGERKSLSLSRQNSQRSSLVVSPQPVNAAYSQQQDPRTGRPVSREGYAGIGARGRSPSPGLPISRSTSPAMAQQHPPPAMHNGSRNSLVSPQRTQTMSSGASQRSVSPNPVGIALDPSGRVAVDSMAERYAAEQQRRQHQQHPQYVQQMPPQQQQPPTVRRASTYGGPPQQSMAPPPGPPQQPAYVPPPPAPAQYAPAPPPHQPQPQPVYQYQQPPPQPQQQYYAAPPPQQPIYQPQPRYELGMGNGIARAPSVYSQAPPQAQHSQQRSWQSQQSGGGGYAGSMYSGRGPSPAPPPPQQQHVNRTPSPQPPPPPGSQGRLPPTFQYTEDGKPVLFYVKALYDYQATIDEEFDFQAGDVIAVTATPEDGWWSGELLDEARRQPGRHIFPSNFVCLF